MSEPEPDAYYEVGRYTIAVAETYGSQTWVRVYDPMDEDNYKSVRSGRFGREIAAAIADFNGDGDFEELLYGDDSLFKEK